jgi:hypothetical protein
MAGKNPRRIHPEIFLGSSALIEMSMGKSMEYLPDCSS